MPDTDPPEQPPVLSWARGGNGASSPTPAPGARGPLVTAASAIAAGLPWRGDLAADSALRLLYLAAAASATGRLELATQDGRFALQLRRGLVERVASDAAADALGAWLVRKGAISAEALARAEGLAGRFGGDLVSALVSFDAFRPDRDAGLLIEHGGALVAKAVASQRGAAQWTPGSVTPVAGFALAPRWGLVCDATRRLAPEVVRDLLGARAQRIASRTGGRVAISELKLIPQEARAATLFDGRSSPAQLAATRPAEAVTILRVALLLAETELLQFGVLAPEPAPPPTIAPARTGAPTPAPTAFRPAPPPVPTRAAPPPPSPPPAAPPATHAPSPATHAPPPVAHVPPAPAAHPAPSTPVPPPADREALEAFHRKLGGADHFEVLGMPRTAGTPQLKAAYFQLAKRYHPDAGAPDEPPETKKLRAEIFARIGEAWGVLGNEKQRADYLRDLEAGRKSDVDIAHIVKAEELFRKAVVLAKGRLYAQALATIEQAIEVNADEPEFDVWRGWLRFLLATDRDAQRAASATTIESALHRAPKCVTGYLFLARMARNMGDLDAAERYLKRGLAMAPHNDELTRELKFIELKRK